MGSNHHHSDHPTVEVAVTGMSSEKNETSDALGDLDITINGTGQSIKPQTSVKTLFSHYGLVERNSAIEINQTIVPRTKYSETFIQAHDVIELVHFVGGG